MYESAALRYIGDFEIHPSFGSDAKAELSLRSMVRKLLSTTPRPEG